jgi:hypothetical protein
MILGPVISLMPNPARKVPGFGRRRVLQVDSIRLGLFHDNEGLYK